MFNQEDQGQEFDKESYLKMVNEILKVPSYKIDLGAMLFGAGIITVPFLIIYTNYASKKLQEKASTIASVKITKNVCTDKYGYDFDGRILNSAGLPKNPPTADDLPTVDITTDNLKVSPIDQHGTYGSALI